MCGIAGHVTVHGAPTNALLVRKMCDAQAHRGPDDAGLVSRLGGRVVLGHRRLAVLDLSDAGHQPMVSCDRRFVLTYNGEVYNYQELRAELGDKDGGWRSDTDTEVVLEALRRWGPSALERFNGMWAFALWDDQERVLLCARDRFGVKPLYYSWDGHRFVFASELKAVVLAMRLLGRSVEPDLGRLSAFLHGLPPPDQWQSFIAGVRHLPAGSIVRVSGSGASEHRYYDLAREVLSEAENHRSDDDETWVERFRAAFDRSVEYRLRSDVPVGSCLSGGLDSSAIVAAIAESRLPRDAVQHTFSAIYDDPDVDESRFVDAVAKHTRVHAHRTRPNAEDLVRDMRRLIWQHDEPFPTTSMFAQYKVFELASQHGIKVMLDGQGADETLGGYDGYFVPRWLEAVSAGELRLLHSEISAFSRYRPRSAVSSYFLLLRWWLRLRFPRVSAWSQALQPTSGWQSSAVLLPPPLTVARPDPATVLRSPLGPLNGYAVAKTTERSLVGLLQYEDRNSMAFGIEARVPFLDFKLVTIACAAPPHLRIHNGATKVLLRRACGGRLPPLVANRLDKMGFPTPMAGWFRGKARPALEEILLGDKTTSRGWIDTRNLRPAIESWFSGANAMSPTTVWSLVAAETWAQIFIDGEEV